MIEEATQTQPNHTSAHPLKEVSVFLSASIPDELNNTFRGQELFPVVAMLTEEILRLGGRLVFGGHPTITPLVWRSARDLLRSLSINPQTMSDRIELHQLRRFDAVKPREAADQQVFPTIHWYGRPDKSGDINEELREMREAMTQIANAAIFIGGKLQAAHGSLPGIRDEFNRFTRNHPEAPFYLTGLLEGESARLIKEVEAGSIHEVNGLNDIERQYLHHETLVEFIVSLIIKDLIQCCGSKQA